MIALVQQLAAALQRLRGGGGVSSGPDPAEAPALALLASAGAPGGAATRVEAARQKLLGLKASSPEGAVLLEAARVVGTCAAGESCTLDALGWAAERLLPADGAPAGDPNAAARALLGLARARAWALRRALTIPPEVDAALASGSDALYRMQGEQDALPGPLARPERPLQDGERPAAWTLHDCALAWGLDRGQPASADDPLVIALTGGSPEGTPSGLATDRWALWSWRETGLAVAHATMLKAPARVFLDARAGHLQWDLPGLPVLSGALGAGGRLEVSRVDGRKLRLIAEAEGWRRDVLVQGSRLIVKDREINQIRFKVPSFEVTRNGDTWSGRAERAGREIKLEIKTDARWRWTLDEGRLEGLRMEGAEELQTSFELRA